MKILPLADNIPIKGLHYIANPLAIILQDQESWAWFFSDYVQLIWYKKEKFLSYYNKYISEIPTCIPCLEFQCMDKQFILRNFDVEKLLIDAIDEGWYIFSSYDEFYIPNLSAHMNKRHFLHDFMMYGYDLKKQEFICNVYTQNRKLERNAVKIDCLMTGLKNSLSDDFEFNRMNLFRRKKNYNFSFSKAQLVGQLESYINGICMDQKYTVPYWHDERVYGINIYDYIIEIFTNYNKSAEDVRIFHLLWEHKKCMTMRMHYMIEHGIIESNDALVNLFEKIESLSLQLKMIQLKMKMTKTNSAYSYIAKKVRELSLMEKEAIENLLCKLNNNKTVGEQT